MATREGKLDESELFLLSRKQVMFADFVTWNDELVGRLEEAGILPGDDYPGIMVSHQFKIARFKSGFGTMEALCSD